MVKLSDIFKPDDGTPVAAPHTASEKLVVFVRRYKQALVALSILAFGVAFAIAKYYLVYYDEVRQTQHYFDVVQQHVSESIASTWDYSVIPPQMMADLYTTNLTITRLAFSKFVSPAAFWPNETIQVIEWCPYVTHAERAQYEADAQSAFPGFTFVDRSASGGNIIAANRSEYFPVYYLEPYQGNEAACGFVLNSNAQRAASINVTRTTGRSVITARLTLVQSTEQQFGALYLLPLFFDSVTGTVSTRLTPQIIGVICAAFKLGTVLSKSVNRLDLRDVDVFLYDLDNPDPVQQYLAHYNGNKDNHYTFNQVVRMPYAEIKGDLVSSKNLKVVDRRWMILTVARNGYITGRISQFPTYMLLLSLGATIISQFYYIFTWIYTLYVKKKTARSVEPGKFDEVTTVEMMSMQSIISENGKPLVTGTIAAASTESGNVAGVAATRPPNAPGPGLRRAASMRISS